MSFLLFLSLFTTTDPFQPSTTNQSIPEALEQRSRELCFKLITQAEKKEQELKLHIKQIQDEPLFKQLKNLQEDQLPLTPLPLKLTTLLTSILEENDRLLQSPLLHDITITLELLEKEKEFSFITPGLRKERVILADIKEEFDFIRTINTITRTNLDQLKTMSISEKEKREPKNNDLFLELYEQYKTLKATKKLVTLFEELEFIEAQITITKLKDKKYVQLRNLPEAAEFRKKEFESAQEWYKKQNLLKQEFFLSPIK